MFLMSLCVFNFVLNCSQLHLIILRLGLLLLYKFLVILSLDVPIKFLFKKSVLQMSTLEQRGRKNERCRRSPEGKQLYFRQSQNKNSIRVHIRRQINFPLLRPISTVQFFFACSVHILLFSPRDSQLQEIFNPTGLG